jgi:hypothetical protein
MTPIVFGRVGGGTVSTLVHGEPGFALSLAVDPIGTPAVAYAMDYGCAFTT